MNTNKENLTQNNYPLSEEEFRRLEGLSQKELSKQIWELRKKFQDMLYMKKQEMGLLDWE